MDVHNEEMPPPPQPTPMGSHSMIQPPELNKTVGSAEEAELKDLQKPALAARFRDFCGNPEGNEGRLKQLEHHVGNLILRHQSAENRERKREVETTEYENNVRQKMEDLDLSTKQHAELLVDLPTLKSTVEMNKTNIDRIHNKIREVEQETS